MGFLTPYSQRSSWRNSGQSPVLYSSAITKLRIRSIMSVKICDLITIIIWVWMCDRTIPFYRCLLYFWLLVSYRFFKFGVLPGRRLREEKRWQKGCDWCVLLMTVTLDVLLEFLIMKPVQQQMLVSNGKTTGCLLIQQLFRASWVRTVIAVVEENIFGNVVYFS